MYCELFYLRSMKSYQLYITLKRKMNRWFGTQLYYNSTPFVVLRGLGLQAYPSLNVHNYTKLLLDWIHLEYTHAQAHMWEHSCNKPLTRPERVYALISSQKGAIHAKQTSFFVRPHKIRNDR